MLQSRLERFTDGSGHANIDGTAPIAVPLKDSNQMTDDEIMCRPEMQLRYAKSKSKFDSEDMTLVCCHRAPIAAPIPSHAPVILCTTMSFCRFTIVVDKASRCVMSARAAVYTFPVQPSPHYL